MSALTVHNAEIRTAAVEIQTLTVSDRQVTQAVFKQLPQIDLIAEDGTLNGDPWGWVNYHPAKCDNTPHLHVVCQQGKGLFRTHVSLEPQYPRWIDVEASTAWVDAKVRHDVTSLLTGWKPQENTFLKIVLGIPVRMAMSAQAQEATMVRTKLEDLRASLVKFGGEYLVTVSRPKRPIAEGMTGMEIARLTAASFRKVPVSEAMVDAEGQLDKALAALPVVSLAEADEALAAEARVEVERRRRHAEVREALASLPQLFIAA